MGVELQTEACFSQRSKCAQLKEEKKMLHEYQSGVGKIRVKKKLGEQLRETLEKQKQSRKTEEQTVK